MARASSSGHQLLFPPADWRPVFAVWTTQDWLSALGEWFDGNKQEREAFLQAQEAKYAVKGTGVRDLDRDRCGRLSAQPNQRDGPPCLIYLMPFLALLLPLCQRLAPFLVVPRHARNKCGNTAAPQGKAGSLASKTAPFFAARRPRTRPSSSVPRVASSTGRRGAARAGRARRSGWRRCWPAGSCCLAPRPKRWINPV